MNSELAKSTSINLKKKKHGKDTISKVKRKIKPVSQFGTYVTDKGLLSLIYKEF